MAAPDGRTPYDFVYDKVTISADRGGAIDIADAIVEMSIFEHLWEPWSHGRIMLADTADLFQSIQFRGTERVNVKISFPNNDEKKPYHKTFVITNIESHKKGNDNAAVILFDVIEEHFFKSKIKRINQAFDGKPNQIVSRILSESDIGKTLAKQSDEVQAPFRYIVPKESPLKAIQYVTNKATTVKGFPYFLYSPLSVENELVWKSLEDIIQDGPIFQDEFIYSQWHTGKQDGTIGVGSSSVDVNDPRNSGQQNSRARSMIMDQKALTIENYQHWNSYDLLSRVQSGAIGSRYLIRNANQFDAKNYHYDYTETLSEVRNLMPSKQRRLSYDEKAYEGIHNNDAVDFYIAYLNVLYSDGMANPYDMEMQDNPKRISIAHSLRENMKFDNVDVQVPGYHFFDFNGNTNTDGRSIGRSIRLLFMNNDVEFDPNDPDKFVDKKLSGQYFITAAHHHFDTTKYTVSATCSKYAELNE